MQYKVSIGRNNKFAGLARDMFEEDEEVVFTVPFVTDVNTYVTSKDVHIKRLPSEHSTLKYSFIMPAHDVKVEITFSGGMTCMHQNIGMPFMGMKMMDMQRMAQPPEQSFSKENSKFCKDCGGINEKTAKFCRDCGCKFE